MITFFACPKPFDGHVDVIQRNAIKSWTLLRPRPEIILLGVEKGIAETCKEFGLIHVAETDRNEYGTPLVDSVFQIGQSRASEAVVCYVNSDIILMSDFLRAVEAVVVRMSKFLIVGQRWDVDIKHAYDFSSADWETGLRWLMARTGKLHAPTGIDFFCFPRGTYANVPPFAIGRLAWDNWLVWRARSKRVPVVDVTDAVAVIHQSHDYAADTIKGRKSDGHWVELGPEARRNLALLPEAENLNIWAATWTLDQKGRLRRRPLTPTPSYLYYQLKCVLPLYWPAFGKFIRWVLAVRMALLRALDGRLRESRRT